MKKIILSLVVGLLVSLSIQAQLNRSLVLVNANQEAFTVVVNQNQINSYALKEVRVSGLFDNFYDIIIKAANSNRTVTANLYLPPLSEIVYQFNFGNSYNSPGMFTIIGLTPTQENTTSYQSGGFVFGESTQIGMGGNQISININNTMDTSVITTPDPVVIQEPMVVYVEGYSGAVGCDRPLSESRFSSMLNTIEDQSFASSKKRIARQIISNNCMVVSHLVEILDLFSFESDKLEMAKFAYDYIYDIENYYEVNNVFDFESSIEELDNYLQHK